MKAPILATLLFTSLQLFAQSTSVRFLDPDQARGGVWHQAIPYLLAGVVVLLILAAVKIWRRPGGRPPKTTGMILVVLGGLGLSPLCASDLISVASSGPSATAIYEQMFQRMKGKLLPLTDSEGHRTEDLSRLLLFRPRSTNFSESDLQLVLKPINRYPVGAKYPYVGDKKNFHPMLSLYDAKTIPQAARCLGNDMGWVITAQAMRESVRVSRRIEHLLSDTKFSLVALRPLDFYAKDGARIGAIFCQRAAQQSSPAYFIYFLDPAKIGNMPEVPWVGKYLHGERDKQYYFDTRACDRQTAEFVRAVHQEVEAAAAEVSDLSEAR